MRNVPSLALAAFIALIALGCGPDTNPVHSGTWDSEVYPVDQIYRSMMGPKGSKFVSLGDPVRPELVWITGYRTQIIDSDGTERVSDEFMCHSNLDAGPLRAGPEYKWRRNNPRLFTLSQGQMEVEFPEGFGIPVVSTEKLRLDTQVLNLNEQQDSFGVKHRTTIEYVREVERVTPMRPLFQEAAQGMVLLSGPSGHYGVEDPDAALHGPGCAVGMAAGERVIKDDYGREFAAHWVVQPGREVNRTNVTRWIDLAADTTIHYIAVHVHPFAESVELVDLTTGETVFRSEISQADARIGLDHVEAFSSPEGIPIYADHEYEVVSVYDNTTDEPQDAMAVLFLYMLDTEFQRSTQVAVRERR